MNVTLPFATRTRSYPGNCRGTPLVLVECVGAGDFLADVDHRGPRNRDHLRVTVHAEDCVSVPLGAEVEEMPDGGSGNVPVR